MGGGWGMTATFALDRYLRSRDTGRAPRWGATDGVYLAHRLLDQVHGNLMAARHQLHMATAGSTPLPSPARQSAHRLIEAVDGDLSRAFVLVNRCAAT